MSSTILLLVMLTQGVLGTFPPGFPPVSNPPPIPAAEVVRTNSQPSFYVQEDITQDVPQPSVRDDGLFLTAPKPDDQRWYFQENQSAEVGEPQTSIEAFDRYYQSGEPAIGPVATPIPDDNYLAQPSSISRLNPSDTGNIDSGVWILTRGSDPQYNTQERWIQVEVPNERILEVVNQDPGLSEATDTVKTVVGPTFPAVPDKNQLPPQGIVQQVWVQASPPVASQKVFPAAVVNDIPSVKQIIDIPQTSAKQVFQQKIVSGVQPPPLPPPAPAQIITKQGFAAPPPTAQIITKQGFAAPPAAPQIITKQGFAAPPASPQIITKQGLGAPPTSPQIITIQGLTAPPASQQIITKQGFSAPPPPPPPLKGLNASPKFISNVPININPESNVIISDKSINPNANVVPGKNVLQQVRHIWIPTSPRTGKFITVPVSSSINAGKSIANKGLSLDSTPVVSDTWVLKQDGQIPSFEQQKSALPPPVIQNGKLLIQNPPVIQVSKSDIPPSIAPVLPAKSAPFIGKSVVANGPSDIWPKSKDGTNSKIGGKYPVVLSQASPIPVSKSNAAAIGNFAPPYPLPPSAISQKSVVRNAKSAVLPPVPPQAVQIINGKPCPLPPPIAQKSFLPYKNPTPVTVPRIIATQNLPFSRIIRVNRYPTGSYYLLNRNIRPSYFTYPSQPLIQQPRARYIRLLQTKQSPVPIQGKQLLPSPVTKQISIPVQSKQIISPFSTKPFSYPYTSRQIILPATQPKSTRIIYPAIQAIRYPYPLSAYLNPNPTNKGLYVPQFSSLKIEPTESNSDSSSSESSSSEDSSESSKEVSKEEKEEISESGESVSSSESEKESESESGSKSDSDSDSTSEAKSEEASEASSELEVEETRHSPSKAGLRTSI